MKTFVPQYYNRFKCRANKCKHTCCAGWEIDIDSDTLTRYNSIGGEWGEKIRKSITTGDGNHCFALIDDKCPFLRNDGLCDIIANLGEDYLCQICSDHPRFRNFIADRVEIGLGLTCEEVASLVLYTDENDLTVTADDGASESLDEWESYILNKREKMFRIAKSDESFATKCQKILSEVNATMPEISLDKWRKIYLSLERLENKWTTTLENLTSTNAIRDEKIYSRILTYMLFRHILDASDESDLKARTLFCVHATTFISAVATTLDASGELNPDCESARLYSSEIEYSTDNLYSLIDLFNR